MYVRRKVQICKDQSIRCYLVLIFYSLQEAGLAFSMVLFNSKHCFSDSLILSVFNCTERINHLRVDSTNFGYTSIYSQEEFLCEHGGLAVCSAGPPLSVRQLIGLLDTLTGVLVSFASQLYAQCRFFVCRLRFHIQQNVRRNKILGVGKEPFSSVGKGW